jgi:DNA modification methylase
MVDMGSAKLYVDRHTTEMPHLPDEEQDVRPENACNLFFASKHYFSGHRQVRRDDIIQIAYNLIYLSNPERLEMAEIFFSANDVLSKMREYKLSSSPEKICGCKRT